MNNLEHKFGDTGFEPCEGCGKYVEQLMNERYCTPTANAFYPSIYKNAENTPLIFRDGIVYFNSGREFPIDEFNFVYAKDENNKPVKILNNSKSMPTKK